MHLITHWLLMGLIGLLALPVGVLTVQIVLACLPKRTKTPPQYSLARPTVAVLIPANNEEFGIAHTIATLKSQLGPQDRILVIADNCIDQTVEQALKAGAEVHVRNNSLLLGKSYALDHGIRTLALDPRQIVIIVDADCEALPGTIDALARKSHSTGCPVQSLNLMLAPNRERPAQRLAEFAWRVKNQVRPSGFARVGFPCQLMGTGMAFPWAVISQATLSNEYLAEDVKLGLDLAREGYPAQFCPEACVVSLFPTSETGTRTQRTRWEHGHLSLILQQLPSFLLSAVRERNSALLTLALDLLVPPLALLALAVGMMLPLSLIYILYTNTWSPILAATALNLTFMLAIMLAWWKAGRELIRGRDLLYAVGYALHKLPLYIRFLKQRQAQWIRTDRD